MRETAPLPIPNDNPPTPKNKTIKTTLKKLEFTPNQDANPEITPPSHLSDVFLIIIIFLSYH
jgi:hypothetical protein